MFINRAPTIDQSGVLGHPSACSRSRFAWFRGFHKGDSDHQHIWQMRVLRIFTAVILLLGSSLAAIISASLLVAVGLWGLVIVLAWKELLETAFR